MAVRAFANEVREIIDFDPDLNVTAFIRAANVKVNWLVSKDTDSLIDAATAKEIETWLAAHFCAIRDQQYQAKATGKANGQFQGRTDMVLMSTYWGQMACTLDPTGLLAQSSKDAADGVRRVAHINWLGKPKNEQTANLDEVSSENDE